jgi:hypothetical protein
MKGQVAPSIQLEKLCCKQYYARVQVDFASCLFTVLLHNSSYTFTFKLLRFLYLINVICSCLCVKMGSGKFINFCKKKEKKFVKSDTVIDIMINS